MNAPDAPCQGVGPGVEFSNCLFQAAKQRDRELQEVYRQTAHVMSGDELRQLAKAQKLWMSYRKTVCDAEYAGYGVGTGGPPTHSACLEALTRARIKDLRDGFGWLVEKRKPYP
jgi:uncharacterized protein YecT (DUF1311 family)